MAGILMTDPGFGRGHTLGVTDPEQGTSVTGTQKTFTDSDPRTSEASKFYSNRPVTCLAMRNVSGSTVEAGTVVAFTAADILNSFDSAAADATGLCGVVDEYLPPVVSQTINGETVETGGCADGDVCWVVVSGPTAATTSAAPAAGDEVGITGGEIADGADGIFAISAPGVNTDAGKVRVLIGACSEHSIGP